jgi:Na+-translocating ferredoxin:NAD+ oxidoreductase RnfE subunit
MVPGIALLLTNCHILERQNAMTSKTSCENLVPDGRRARSSNIKNRSINSTPIEPQQAYYSLVLTPWIKTDCRILERQNAITTKTSCKNLVPDSRSVRSSNIAYCSMNSTPLEPQ